MCFPLFPKEKGKHINNLTPTHFRDNPAKLFMFIGFLAPDRCGIASEAQANYGEIFRNFVSSFAALFWETSFSRRATGRS